MERYLLTLASILVAILQFPVLAEEAPPKEIDWQAEVKDPIDQIDWSSDIKKRWRRVEVSVPFKSLALESPAPDSEKTKKVLLDLGTVNDKKVFATVNVPSDSDPGTYKTIGTLLQNERGKTLLDAVAMNVLQTDPQGAVQLCLGSRMCVKTDKDGNCIKWVCR